MLFVLDSGLQDAFAKATQSPTAKRPKDEGRPATTFSYLVNYSVFGNADRPLGYHVVNWLLHTANVWLLFGLAMRIGRRLWPAIFLAALWAVHPLGTEAVTNIVGRADLLAAFGVLASFYAYLEAAYAGGSRWVWTAISAAAMTVAVFSKESAVAGVGVIVLYDLVCRDKSFRFDDAGRRWVILALPTAGFRGLWSSEDRTWKFHTWTIQWPAQVSGTEGSRPSA